MINALIVDDDMATVEVVRNAVHWKQLGVENVSKAYNIEQAKKILLNEPINLVISDVEMPMGSGLDLLRWFREQKMDGEFLLLTCHEDFSYASEALHNRAAEYLLKPFDVDVMEVALRRIIIRIKEQQALKKNSELGVWVKDNYDEVQLSFWNSVLEGRFEEKPQQAAQEIAKRQLALDPQADYTLIVGRLTNLAKDETRFGRDLLLFAVKNVFSELLCGRPENDSILCNDRHTEILVTAICSEGQEKLQERCILLMKQTESIMNSILTVCICNPCRVENLYSMHQEAIQALVHNVADYGTCFHLSDAQAETINGSFTLDTKKLEESVFKRDKRAIFQYVKDHLEEGMKTKQLSIEALQSARQTLLQIVYVELAKADCKAPDLFNNAVAQELSEKSVQSMMDFIRWANYLLSTAFSKLELTARQETISQKVHRYIKEHYAENIDRNSIAEEFYVNPEYLGKIYKRETGKNLKDAVSEYRIQKARELLSHPNIRIGEIAMEVGFDSFAYFSTLFKKYTGTTPNEYRKNLNVETKED